MQQRDEIAQGLAARFDEVVTWFAERPDAAFITGPEGRWTEGQHLDHLIKSTKPLNLALRLPRIALRLKFGTVPQPGTNYDAVVARYEGTLSDGGKASGRFIPPTVAVADKARLLQTFQHEGERLVKVVRSWRDPDLDTCQLPHPLLGNLTVREMLFFTHHHMGHHLETLARDYARA